MAELVREIMIDASPETIWPYLIDPEKHVEWNGTIAELDPRPGGVHLVLIGGQHQASGEYVEVVPNEKVVFTFGWEQEGNPITPGSTTVEISLQPEGDKRRSARAPRLPGGDQQQTPLAGTTTRPARRRTGGIPDPTSSDGPSEEVDRDDLSWFRRHDLTMKSDRELAMKTPRSCRPTSGRLAPQRS
jgi:uncharacterized protein YndB with AHSA1/START domain